MRIRKLYYFLFLSMLFSLMLVPFSYAQFDPLDDFDPWQALVDLLDGFAKILDNQYATLGLLVIAFWVLLYFTLLMAFKKVYKGKESKELKVISGSLALIMILSFFFVGGGDVLTRARDLLGSFNGLTAVVLTILIWVAMNGIFTSWGFSERWSKIWSTLLALIMGISFLSLGIATSITSNMWRFVINLVVIIGIIMIFWYLSTKTASESSIFGGASRTVRKGMGLDDEGSSEGSGGEGSSGEKDDESSGEKRLELVEDLKTHFYDGVRTFHHFVELENKKNEFISHLIRKYDSHKYKNVVDFLTKKGEK